jgi:16S rRNA (guanine527-N7)-methyltransferase
MNSIAQQIDEGLSRMGLKPPASVVKLLTLHAQRVLEVNAVMNLTAITEAEFVPLHILDSLSALEPLMNEPLGAFADLGSGAGYPGIPLAAVSGRPVALVESVRKKAAFLEEVCREMRLEATVHPIRAEELALTSEGAFGAVVARALSSLPSLVELAAPLLANRGALICMKGKPDAEELARGDAAAALCGMTRESILRVTVPRVEGERTIVVFRKTGEPSTRLPRRTGLAQRQPLT